MIGIATDGYPIYSRLDKRNVETPKLDICGGHTLNELGYHYHANNPGSNQILSCFSAAQACSQNDSGSCDESNKRPPNGDKKPLSFTEMDLNHDGRLSKSEITDQRLLGDFNRFDINQDNYLSQQELPPLPK